MNSYLHPSRHFWLFQEMSSFVRPKSWVVQYVVARIRDGLTLLVKWKKYCISSWPVFLSFAILLRSEHSCHAAYLKWATGSCRNSIVSLSLKLFQKKLFSTHTLPRYENLREAFFQGFMKSGTANNSNTCIMHENARRMNEMK